MSQIFITISGFVLPCLLTTLGACLIFFFVKESKIANIVTIGLASGIMLSASIWSLLIPSQEMAAETLGNLSFLPVIFGFAFGCIFMILLDVICAKFFKTNSQKEKQKAFKLFSAISIHNIPEGLSVGFAVGSVAISNTSALSTFIFILGIALQNFPEGLATAIPINNCIGSRKKSFFLAFLSGIIEPIFAILGYFLATSLTNLLPWLLSFSAGAMIYVIIEELFPELHIEENRWATWTFLIGFILMMVLDVCL